MFGSFLIFILVLSLLVFVHEFGHFIAAKKSGAAVEEFGFGFPPRIAGIKRGGTIYSINWIPLGGFVRIKGENGDGAKDPDSFGSKPAWKRAIILAAGVVMNLLLAWVLLTAGFIIGIPQIVDDTLPKNATIADHELQVVSILPESPAEKAGIEAGDVVVTIDGVNIENLDAFRAATSSHTGENIEVGYLRDGVSGSATVAPVVLKETGRPGIGVGLAETGTVSYPFYIAPFVAMKSVWSTFIDTFKALGGIFRDLLVTQRVSVDVSGPVGIAFLTADVAKLGGLYLLQFIAVLSINLAVINILPIPALDGGRLLFLIIEKLRGRGLKGTTEGAIHAIGFFLLISLVVFVTYRDLIKFGDRIIGAFTGA